MKDLKSRTLRGGAARSGAQVANFLLRTICLIAFARLLAPTDFGLVGMVTVVTGFLGLFREFGLSLATVQRLEISDEQTSTLFWINVAVGIALLLASIATAPLVASFYGDPRLVRIMEVLGLGFLFNSAGVQHSALLQRQLRFTALAIIDVNALVISSAVSLAMAFKGFGYWSLVAWSVVLPLTTTLQLCFHSGWIPGRPSLKVGADSISMLRFGGIVTLNSLVVHFAYNVDKMLLGRFRGAEAVGIYGRAYQLITLPIEMMNSTIGGVAISVLSRLQDEPDRLRSYFNKGYALVLAMTIPAAIMCALFAEQIVLIMFGPRWSEAIPVFRYLAPAVLVFAIINPSGWLLVALGLVGRSLRIALVIAPLVIIGCVAGLPYGAKGVALGFSVAMVLWVIPHLLWCFHGTGISIRDVALSIGRPLIAGAAGAVCALVALDWVAADSSALLTGILGGIVFVAVYLCILLFVMRQSAFYMDIIRSLRRRPEDKAFVLS